MRLIDADAFKEYLRKGAETNADIIPQRLVDAVLDIMDGIMLDIDEQPTIDAEPVVRCGDCKYLRIEPTAAVCDLFVYDSLYMICHHVKNARDFCSYGERRNDETD